MHENLHNSRKKLVLFDWGDVLLDVNSPIYNAYSAIKDIGRDMEFEQHSFIQFLKQKEFWRSSGQQFDKLINDYLKEVASKYTIEEFKSCYLKHFRRIAWFEDMIKLVVDIHEEGIARTGVISNLCELDGDLLAEKLPMDKVDYRFYSYNLGVEKPESRIYEIAETFTGCMPEDIFNK